ncbi:MAG: NAD(P)-binding domain-containing protein [Candidatus Levybacteria bacterium]|nr:NAD(P)-binding domain-containing protein [Candidatus Levybacteria bacterium]
MKIAIIGAGDVGGTLAKRFEEVGHRVFLGVRDENKPKVKRLLSKNISAHSISEAVKNADVIVTAADPRATKEIAKHMGDISGKVIIDVMNAFRGVPKPYGTTTEALLAYTNTKDIVRCFNTTGFKNMENPIYKGEKIDMFVGGDSTRGKKIATKLAKQIGFGKIYDLGGNESFILMEQIVIVWVELSKILGRDIAIKILQR